MENPKNMFFVKAIMVGEKSVGKTQIINRWRYDKFTLQSRPSIGANYETMEITSHQQKVTLQVWDMPGGFDDFNTVICRSSELSIIVVSASDHKRQKIQQIQDWLKRIESVRSDNHKIAIIENKTDLESTYLLTDEDLAQFKGQYAYYQAFSAKDSTQESLNNHLRTILPVILPGLNAAPIENIAQAMQPPLRADYAVTKTNITALNETHANILLNSLRYLLIRGPINEDNKRYDMKFGGGMSFQLKENTTITVPNHVFDWIHKINNIILLPKEEKIRVLCELYDAIILAASIKPFRRSTSTHDFYHSLLGFIEHCVQRSNDSNNDYFSIKQNITDLSQPLAYSTMISAIVDFLEQGALSDSYHPYKIPVFRGKSHLTTFFRHNPKQQHTINVPNHVASLIAYLNMTWEDLELKISFALDYSLVTKFSHCSSRDQTTQEFYDQLPSFIAAQINSRVSSLSAVVAR